MNGEKTGIDHIHTAISEQLHWLLFSFEKQFEARYNTKWPHKKNYVKVAKKKCLLGSSECRNAPKHESVLKLPSRAVGKRSAWKRKQGSNVCLEDCHWNLTNTIMESNRVCLKSATLIETLNVVSISCTLSAISLQKTEHKYLKASPNGQSWSATAHLACVLIQNDKLH